MGERWVRGGREIGERWKRLRKGEGGGRERGGRERGGKES